jgi:glutamate 5-kinase
MDGFSLLPVGITKVVGSFNVGDVVSIVDENNIAFAKGNPNFSSGELNLIKGLQVTEVHKKLGNEKAKEVIEHHNIHLIEVEK